MVFIPKMINSFYKEVDYVWSLKLVLIQHSPWLLLVKIKCQLQNSWKIEFYEINLKLTATSNFGYRFLEEEPFVKSSIILMLSVLNILWVSQVQWEGHKRAKVVEVKLESLMLKGLFLFYWGKPINRFHLFIYTIFSS